MTKNTHSPANPSPPAANVVVDQPVVGEAPLVVRRIVKFGDTDAAGVVYTGRFLDFALEAYDTWLRVALDLAWPKQAAANVGAPAVSCHLEFSRSLCAGDQLDIEVRLDRIGNSSFTVRTVGRNGEGLDIFVAVLIFATVDNSARESVRIPDAYRARMEAYVAACEGR